MATFGATNVQCCPFAVPVKRYRVFALVLIVEPLEILVLDSSRSFLVKQAERYLIFCVWFCEQILECAPVRKRDASGSPAICDLEEYGVLFSSDFVLDKARGSARIGLGQDSLYSWGDHVTDE